VIIGVEASVLSHLNGGISYYLFHLLKELVLQRKDCLFYLYAFSDEGDISHFKQYDNVRIRKIPFFSFWHSIWLQTAVAFFCWRDKLDLFWGPVQAVPLLKKKSLKTILTLHDFTYLLYPRAVPSKKCLFLKMFSKWMLKTSDYITPVSFGTGKRLLHHYGLNYHSVIHPPIKPEMRFKTEEEAAPLLSLQRLEYGRYVISVGTLEPRKNFIKLVRIYLKILSARALNEVLPLVIIGSGGWKNKQIIRTLEEARNAYPSHVKLLGHVQDEALACYLSGAHRYLTLSCYEGYGMPIAEARVCGTPIACPDIPEMKEAAENDGIFFNDENIEEKLFHIFVLKNGRLEQKERVIASYLPNKAKATILGKIIDEK
jgi:glycosyltransferase involved in cell wall biosynthesis